MAKLTSTGVAKRASAIAMAIGMTSASMASTGMAVGILAVGTMTAGIIQAASTVAHAEVPFVSKEAAFIHGHSAYKSRQYEIAVPALTFAAERGIVRAQFYLAKIYSDNSGGWTDHAKAYRLLGEIVDKHANVDPKDYRIAPFVAQALTSIARYERDGIAAIKLPASTKRALVYFDHAATYFSDADAQFELAKHYLAGDGVTAQVPYALNWLAQLSKRAHPGAQAFLANLYWDGRTIARDRVRALALITVAVGNANEEDRFWIEDVHQNIFCEASKETRRRVHEVADQWLQRFGRPVLTQVDGDQLAGLSSTARRLCANGDIVGDLLGRGRLDQGMLSATAPGAPLQPRVSVVGEPLGGERSGGVGAAGTGAAAMAVSTPMVAPESGVPASARPMLGAGPMLGPGPILGSSEPTRTTAPSRSAGAPEPGTTSPTSGRFGAAGRLGHLNGFGLTAADGRDAASDVGDAVGEDRSRSGRTVVRDRQKDLSPLNGFILQGGASSLRPAAPSGFGFSPSGRGN